MYTDASPQRTTRSNAMTGTPPPSKRQRTEPNEDAIMKLTGDELLLIFDILRDEDPWFLSRLCLVSKSFQALATPLLYRSVVLPRRLDDLTKTPDGLLCRLLADSHVQLRSYVQELTVPHITASSKEGRRDDFTDHDYLAQLVDHLPNLRLIRMMCSMPFANRYFDSLDRHPNKPEVQMLSVSGWEWPPPSHPINSVSTIKASIIRDIDIGTGTPSLIYNFQPLFFACPNLKACSLTMYGPYQDPERLGTFEMTGEEKFPPLESLSLNGYYIHPNEWPHWRDRFCWPLLSTLEVGPQPDFTDKLLHTLNGYTTSLKSFKIAVWAGEDEAPAQESLELFLYGFDSLESLDITNYVCPVEAMANHTKLVRLSVHLSEEWDSEESVPWWNSEDLDYLDENCPNLEVLEIDFERQSGAWDQDILLSLAKGFDCLRELSLHIRVGSVRGEVSPLTPVLNYESAREIGSFFFEARKYSFDYFRSRKQNKPTDRLDKLLLKTGAEMRLFNRFDRDREVEELNKKTFVLLRRSKYHASELDLIHPERDIIEAQNQQGFPGVTTEKTRNVIRAGEVGALHEDFLGSIDAPAENA